MIERDARRYRELTHRITGTTRLIVWSALGITYVFFLVVFLWLCATSIWWWAAILALTVAAFFAGLFLYLKLAVWERNYLSRSPLQPLTVYQEPEPQPIEEVAGPHQVVSVYEPSMQAEWPTYEQGYVQQ